MIPSKEKCFELLKKYRVPENIVAHTLEVNRVAMFLAKKLKEKGEEINLGLVDAASLLHDLDKHMTLNEDSGHGKKAAEILESLGFAEVAPIVRKHITTAVLHSPLKTWEEKLVYYADMRVKGNKIVTVEERFEYLRERYGKMSEKAMREINKAEPIVKEIEKEILSKAGVSEKLEGIDIN